LQQCQPIFSRFIALHRTGQAGQARRKPQELEVPLLSVGRHWPQLFQVGRQIERHRKCLGYAIASGSAEPSRPVQDVQAHTFISPYLCRTIRLCQHGCVQRAPLQKGAKANAVLLPAPHPRDHVAQGRTKRKARLCALFSFVELYHNLAGSSARFPKWSETFSLPLSPHQGQEREAFETGCKFMCASSEAIRADWVASIVAAQQEVCTFARDNKTVAFVVSA
jgi:hypothetical protein